MSIDNKSAIEFEQEDILEDAAVLTAEAKRAQMLDFDREFQVTTKTPEKSLALAILQKMPIFLGLLNSVDGGEKAIGAYAKTVGRLTVKMDAIGKGFHIAGLAIDAAHFLLIPLTALVAYLVNEPAPFTVSTGAKWAYSAVVLGLGLTSLLVPGVAPIVIGTTVALGFVTSVATFAKLIMERRRHKAEIKRLDNEIGQAKEELQAIQERAQELTSEEEIEACYQEFLSKQKQIQKNVNKKAKHESALKLKDGMRMMDKGVGMGLSALALLGGGLTVAFPPVGLTILAATAVVGGLYILGRIAAPLLAKAGRAFMGLFGKKDEEPVVEEEAPAEHEVDNNLEQENLLGSENQPVPDSPLRTAPVAVEPIHDPAPRHADEDDLTSDDDRSSSDGYDTDKPVQSLTSSSPLSPTSLSSDSEVDILQRLRPVNSGQRTEKDLAAMNDLVDRHIASLGLAIQTHNAPALLAAVIRIDKDMKEYGTSPDFASELLREVPGWPESAHTMLESALNELPENDERKHTLYASSVMRELLGIHPEEERSDKPSSVARSEEPDSLSLHE
ncbi:hypothetical protein [Legionella sp. CNM-4043-24]|uniref:hypothetical protein n=1 Tax=Legionella sp. CNM-4043-24 TaxID=3421646 RepID=UPI00403B14C8